jgi:hypothetical protein
MAVTTLTASLALSTVTPPSVHAGTNTLSGTYNSGATVLSLSASGLLLLAKIPVNAKNVQLISRHTTGATSYSMDFGIGSGDSGGTNSASVLGSAVVFNAVHISPPVSPVWDDAAGERHQYVTGILTTATATTSLIVNYSITYNF